MKPQRRLNALLTLALGAAFATGVCAQDGTFQELAAPASDEDDLFGVDVDIAGDLIVVGAELWSAVGSGEIRPFGAAFLYQRDNAGTPNNPSDDTYLLLATLRVDSGSGQGRGVATDGMSVFVGGSNPSRIYEEMGGGVWAPVVELPRARDAAMRGGTLVFISAGSAGNVEVWERSGNSWSQTQVIVPGNNLFGFSVDYDGNRIAVTGRNSANDPIIITYTKPGNVWEEEQTIVPSIPESNPTVRLDADTMVYLPIGGSRFNSKVLVLQNDPTLGWVETQVITASDKTFGSGVEIDGDRIYLGTNPICSISCRPGVDIYERGATRWELSEVIPDLFVLSEDGVTAIAAANGTVVVGQERLSFPRGGASVFRVPFYAATTDVANVPVPLTDGVTGEQPVEITFSNISTSGTTSLTTTQQAPSVPSGFSLSNPVIFYQIETTANFSGTVTLCIDYSNVFYVNESDLRLLHFDGSAWVDVTTSVDTVNDIICGETTSLSPFAIVDATAAPDPVLMILDLVADVAALNLAHGIENSLDAKLDNALDTFADVLQQNDGAALNSMDAFISAVNAQSGNKIPTADAENLIQFAEEIIAVLKVLM